MAGSGGRSAAGVLHEPVQTVRARPKAEFEAYTGLALERVEAVLAIARTKELIEISATAGSSPLGASLPECAA